MKGFTLSNKNFKRRDEIRLLTSMGFSINRIAKELGIDRSAVIGYKMLFKIKALKGRGRPKTTKLNKVICSLLNKEHPSLPLSDVSLCKIIKDKYKINTRVRYICTARKQMKIPPVFNTKNIDSLNRKILYFTQGRWIWKEDGNHIKGRKK